MSNKETWYLLSLAVFAAGSLLFPELVVPELVEAMLLLWPIVWGV